MNAKVADLSLNLKVCKVTDFVYSNEREIVVFADSFDDLLAKSLDRLEDFRDSNDFNKISCKVHWDVNGQTSSRGFTLFTDENSLEKEICKEHLKFTFDCYAISRAAETEKARFRQSHM